MLHCGVSHSRASQTEELCSVLSRYNNLHRAVDFVDLSTDRLPGDTCFERGRFLQNYGNQRRKPAEQQLIRIESLNLQPRQAFDRLQLKVEAYVAAGGITLVHLNSQNVRTANQHSAINRMDGRRCFCCSCRLLQGQCSRTDWPAGEISAKNLNPIQITDRSIIPQETDRQSAQEGRVRDDKASSEPGRDVFILGRWPVANRSCLIPLASRYRGTTPLANWLPVPIRYPGTSS